jgi:hypothetical protein
MNPLLPRPRVDGVVAVWRTRGLPIRMTDRPEHLEIRLKIPPAE